MKVLGINFSPRKGGNCYHTLNYCLNQFNDNKNDVEYIHFYDLNISPCNSCDYECFQSECIIKDDVKYLFDKCHEVDKIIFALPTYCGNLPSSYFMFSERSQGIFKNDLIYRDYLKKIHIILIGNIVSGASMALQEILFPFVNMPFVNETVIFSSRDYDVSSIRGNLIQFSDVKRRLNHFIKKIE